MRDESSADAGPSILIIDDNEDNRYTLSRRLKKDGYNNLVSVESGAAGIAQMESRAFDLVLCDIMMPEMSGFEVLDQVKMDPDLRDIPFIMISALDETDSVVRCIELGAEDYLTKPFNPVLLRARVGACLEKKRLRDGQVAYMGRVEGEKKQADELLRAVLPPAAIRELKIEGTVKPRRHDNVAVLFCDLVGFTSFCDQNPPETVVDSLQEVMTAFEAVVERHGLEKIKTIGDALLVTGGLLSPHAEPVVAAAQCGLELVEAAAKCSTQWTASVGIHVGPVVAGIVGNMPYQFDLWGDSVNMAARICDKADKGQVLMSAEAWMEARKAVRCRSQGMIDLRGKGPVELVQCIGMRAGDSPG